MQKENLSSLEKTILGELYKDQAFMDLIAQTLFDTMDSDRSGTIDWQELVIGLSVLTRGSKGDTARCKLRF
jgi:Ca2+-binding EF-hand superfamily protein